MENSNPVPATHLGTARKTQQDAPDTADSADRHALDDPDRNPQRDEKRVDESDGPSLSIHSRGAVQSLAFSPDGTRLAGALIAGATDTGNVPNIQIWDTRTGEVFLQLGDIRSFVYSVTYSPDSKWIAAGSDLIKIWDAENGKEVLTLDYSDDRGGVSAVSFSQDGRRIASARSFQVEPYKYNGDVVIWDTRNGKQLLVFREHEGGVTSLDFSPDGKRIASVSKSVKIWDSELGNVLQTVPITPNTAGQVIFDPQGQRIAWVSGKYGGLPGKLRVFNAEDGRKVLSIDEETDAISSAAFSFDEKLIAYSTSMTMIRPNEHSLVKVVDANTGAQIMSNSADIVDTSCVVFSPDSRRIASGGFEGVRIWDLSLASGER